MEGEFRRILSTDSPLQISANKYGKNSMVPIKLYLEKQKHFESFFMFKNVVSQEVSSPDFLVLNYSVQNLFQHTYINTYSDMKHKKKYI